MERMTHERANGIKTGYWSPATKETLVQRLAAEPGLRAVCTDCGLRGAAGVGLVDTSSKKEEKDHE